MKGGWVVESKQQKWASRFGFILSSAGAAIGLGAIWRLPYVTGTSGGGAFFLLFVLFTILIGLPMLIAEFIIGRGTGLEAVSAYKKIAPKSLWSWIGDRKSTRLNSSHVAISYAVFSLKKKTTAQTK